MDAGKKVGDIVIYPSVLRSFSYVTFGFILLVTGISLIHSDKRLIVIFFLLITGATTALYGIINLSLRKHPVILFDEHGFLYSTYAHAKLFVPKDIILAVSVRNTPNKRIIVTLKPIEQEYEKYLKNLYLPPHLQTCSQNTSKLKGNNVIISTENLNADNNKLLKQLQNYLDNKS